jgi:hypothetical protein
MPYMIYANELTAGVDHLSWTLPPWSIWKPELTNIYGLLSPQGIGVVVVIKAVEYKITITCKRVGGSRRPGAQQEGPLLLLPIAGRGGAVPDRPAELRGRNCTGCHDKVQTVICWEGGESVLDRGPCRDRTRSKMHILLLTHVLYVRGPARTYICTSARRASIGAVCMHEVRWHTDTFLDSPPKKKKHWHVRRNRSLFFPSFATWKPRSF